MTARFADASADARRHVASNQAAYDEPLPQSSAGRRSTVLDVLAERARGAARRARPPVRGRCERARVAGGCVDRPGRHRTAEVVPRAVDGRGRAPEIAARRSRGPSGARASIGSTVSPRPRIHAGPPWRQNGTSDPSAAACSARAVRTRASTAAASAEPPPRPAPAGIPLCSVDRHRAVQQIASARATRLSSSLGTPRGERSGDGRPCVVAASWSSSVVVRLGRRHGERFEVVVTVVAPAEDAQRQRELGEGARTSSRRLGDRGPVGEVERLGPPRSGRCRRSRARLRCGRRAQSRSVLRKRLAAGREAGAHELEQAHGIVHRDRRRDAARACTSALSTFGRGTNTVGGTMPDDPRRRRSTRPSPITAPYALVSTGRREPLADLALHHHEHAIDHRRFFERAHDAPVSRRCTAGSTPSPSASDRRSSAGQSTVIASPHDHGDVSTADHFFEHGQPDAGRARPRDTCAPTSASATVSEPTPGPTSTTWSPGSTPGEADDAAGDVRVGEEVLAERLARAHAVPVEQRADLGRRRHAARRRTPRAAFARVTVGDLVDVLAARGGQRRADRPTTYAGSLGLPRCGTGARYGASVSTSTRSAGASAAAARTSSAFLNDTMPLNDR